jgi:tripartite-type tricarboxylate transporter receptor subunit TctC
LPDGMSPIFIGALDRSQFFSDNQRVKAPIAKRLRDEVAKAVAAPDVVAQLDSQGMAPLATAPEEWAAYLKAELARYTQIMRDANIKPE